MKKILFALLACLFATAVDAQTTLPWGLATGANPRNVQMRDTAGTWDTIGTLNSTTHAFALALGVLPTIPLTQLATQAANTAVANFTGSTAAPVAFTMPSCASPSFLDYTNGTGIICSAITANGVTLGNIAQIAANTILGNFSASTANVAAQTINGGSSCATALTYTNGTGIGCAAGAVSSITVSPSSLFSTVTPITTSATVFSSGTQTSGFRLTLTTGVPVLTSNVTAATSIILTPYVNNTIGLWNSANSAFVDTHCAEMSNVLANSSTGSAGPAAVVASGVYDLFAWNSGTLASPTCTLTRGPAWTNSTTRSAGTALGRNAQGILTNTTAITNGPAANTGTYVGTFVADSGGGTVSWNTGTGASGGGQALLDVWNMYNRVRVSASVTDTGASYTYTAATIRQARASATNGLQCVFGQVEDGVAVNDNTKNSIAASGGFIFVGVGLNSTTAFAYQPSVVVDEVAVATTFGAQAPGFVMPALGVNSINALEEGDGTNANTFDLSSLNVLSAQLRM